MNKGKLTRLQAADIAEKTAELLEIRGYAVWECSELNGERIVVMRDGVTLPMSIFHLPRYTEKEFEIMFQHPGQEVGVRLIHEAKKRGGTITKG